MAKNYRRADTGRFTTAEDNTRNPDRVVAESNAQKKRKKPLLNLVTFIRSSKNKEALKGTFILIFDGDLNDFKVKKLRKNRGVVFGEEK